MIENIAQQAEEQLLIKPQELQRQDEQKRKAIIQKLILVLILGSCFAVIQIIGGIYSHSLAIISDAVHLIVDLLAYFIAIISVWVSSRPANKKHSFGYHRASAVGSLASVVALWFLNGFLVYMSVIKLMDTNSIYIHGEIMLYIASFGLLLNLIMIYILNSELCVPKDNKKKISQSHEVNVSDSRIPENLEAGVSSTKGALAINLNESEKEDQEQISTFYDSRTVNSNLSGKGIVSKTKEGNDSPLMIVDQLDEESKDEIVPISPTLIKAPSNVMQNSNLDSIQHNKDLNIRTTVLHIIGDILHSMSVIVVSFLIWMFPDKMKIADPIITFFFTPFILFLTLKVGKECIMILMDSVPKDFNLKEFEEALKQVEGVEEVHDLHVWSLGIGKNAMSAHIYTTSETGLVLKKATAFCRMYSIYHSTIQIETTKDKKDKRRYIDCDHKLH